jgi:hypothetical protein
MTKVRITFGRMGILAPKRASTFVVERPQALVLPASGDSTTIGRTPEMVARHAAIANITFLRLQPLLFIPARY